MGLMFGQTTFLDLDLPLWSSSLACCSTAWLFVCLVVVPSIEDTSELVESAAAAPAGVVNPPVASVGLS